MSSRLSFGSVMSFCSWVMTVSTTGPAEHRLGERIEGTMGGIIHRDHPRRSWKPE